MPLPVKHKVTVITPFFNLQPENEDYVPWRYYHSNIEPSPDWVKFIIPLTFLFPQPRVEMWLEKFVYLHPEKVILLNPIEKGRVLHSHGESVDFVIREYLHTPYFLSLDYDAFILNPVEFWEQVERDMEEEVDIGEFFTHSYFSHPCACLYKARDDFISLGLNSRYVHEDLRITEWGIEETRRKVLNMESSYWENRGEDFSNYYDVGEVLFFYSVLKGLKIRRAGRPFVEHMWGASYWLSFSFPRQVWRDVDYSLSATFFRWGKKDITEKDLKEGLGLK